MRVVIRTHGGLGNQLFQILFSRLYAEQFHASLREIHDARYKHGFARSDEIALCKEPLTVMERLLSSLRIPKVLQRVGLKSDETASIFGVVYLDGYFQSADQYGAFRSERIGEHLRNLRTALNIPTVAIHDRLVHLRLGDFFSSRDEARLHVIRRLRDIEPNSRIITNQEDLLQEPEIKAILISKGCLLESTKDFTPGEIIRLMAQHSNIDANDSTLVFWASVFGGSHVTLKSERLEKIRKLFSSCISLRS